MQAMDLLGELFTGARIKVIPRAIVTPGTVSQMRKGIVGKVQGLALGDTEEGPAFVFECNNGTVVVLIDEHPAAVEAIKALGDLPCVFPEGKRRANIQREKIENHSRDGADLGLLARVKGS